jgi:lysophospholipase L1-like esterase
LPAYSDFHGRYYTFEHGYRVVPNVPSDYRRTVWLFGNSTTADYFVPDNLTYAAQLQRLVRNDSTRVVNRGTSGQVVEQELLRLRLSHIKPGDIVVFLDGYMDLSPDQPTRIDVTQYLHFVEQASLYSLSHGAAFYHFVQPCRHPLSLPSFIVVPTDVYFDDSHVDERGDALIARAIYDAIAPEF